MGSEMCIRDSRPSAVIAASDTLAGELVGELLDRSVDVPGQMSVVGFDDTAISRWMRPQLTSVSQDIPAKASVAVDLLIRLIEGETHEEAGSPARLPMVLVPRQSTAPPPTT